MEHDAIAQNSMSLANASTLAPPRRHSMLFSVLFAIPVFALVFGSGLNDPMSTTGLVLLLIAANLFVVLLFVVQPALLRREAARPADAMQMATQLLVGMHRDNTLQVSDELLAMAADRFLGARRSSLFILDRDGSLLTSSNEAGITKLFEAIDFSEALRGQGRVVTTAELSARGSASVQRLRDALVRCGEPVLLPLGLGNRFLGFVLVWGPRLRASIESEARLHTLAAHFSAVVSGTAVTANSGSLLHSFQLAGGLQEALMPAEQTYLCQGIRIYGAYRPAEHCGGDLWLFQDIGDGRVLVIIGDATGHGPPAAILGATVKGVVEAYVASVGAELQPGELLAYLDTWVRRVGRGQFVMTAFAVVIEGRTGRVIYSNAGHNFPYVLTRENGRVGISALALDGNLLGGNKPVEPRSVERRLSPGSKLVIFTDGIPEAGAPHIAEFSERRFRRGLQDLFDQAAEHVVKGIVQAVADHCGDTPVSDDMTLVVIDLPPGDQA